MNVLYITYDGITDHIGQSQVAPYLLGLAEKGHKITLLSAEKMDRSDIIIKYQQIFKAGNVDWRIAKYHKNPPVLSTLMDVYKMRQRAGKLIKEKQIEVIHCRSYVASLIGLHFKKKYRIPFIFDMRDFWPDAAKEIKRFDVERSYVHKMVYNFFKRKEKEFLEKADHVISLTKAGKKVIQDWNSNGLIHLKAPVTVIPCCADFSIFDRAKLDHLQLISKRQNLGIKDTDFVLNYLGSLGPTYLTDEMMDFFNVLLKKRPNAKFLVVANNDHHLAMEAAKRKNIDLSKIIVVKGTKEDVPYLIALSDLSLFFIIPSFAKQACSPTKMAELLAMNVPVISNTRVGDLDELLKAEVNHSEVVHSFNEEEYNRVLDLVLSKIGNEKLDLRSASSSMSLDYGISQYYKVYQSLEP